MDQKTALDREPGMRSLKNIRRKLLFALSSAFALLFIAGMCAVVFGSADPAGCAVPPFLGFCFTFPLRHINRKQTPEGVGEGK